MNKNILICVSGLTPQIVTETFFCLAVKEKTSIDEIYVLTTKRGREVMLGKDKHPSTPNTPFKIEIENLCKKYKIRKPAFEENDKHIIVAKEESIELPDIRSDRDNILFPNKVCEFIRDKSADPNTILFCSITGGRKSMSVHMANALSLFARENDKLLHVLTREEHEFKAFYPISKTEIKDLELSEIPFVKLRSILAYEIKNQQLLKLNFDQIVNETQNRIKAVTDKNKLIIDIEKKELRYLYNSASFEPLEFLFYYYFIDSKLRGIDNISVYNFVSDECRLKFISFFNEYFPYYYIKEKKWCSKGFSKSDFRVKRSKVNDKLENLIDDPDIVSFFKIDVNKKYGESTYYIKASKDRFIIKF